MNLLLRSIHPFYNCLVNLRRSNDADGEPIALSANESHIFEMADGTRLTIASSPIYSPMFTRYCAMMRRSDLLSDPRYATARLRRENLASLLAEVRAWLGAFTPFWQ